MVCKSRGRLGLDMVCPSAEENLGVVLAPGSNKLPGGFKHRVSDILSVRKGLERGLSDQ